MRRPSRHSASGASRALGSGSSAMVGAAVTGAPVSLPPRPTSITSISPAAAAIASLMLRGRQKRPAGPRPTTTVEMFCARA